MHNYLNLVRLGKILILGGLLTSLISCSPQGKGFRDQLTSEGNDYSNDRNLIDDEWKNYKVDVQPKIDINVYKDNDQNPMGLPKMLSHGETWLPRTLLVRDLNLLWSSDRMKIFVRGSAQWSDPSTKNSGDTPFALAGNWDTSSGISDLVMIKSEMDQMRDQNPRNANSFNYDDVQVRGRTYCVGVNENFECNSTVVEIFVRIGSTIYSGQYEYNVNSAGNGTGDNKVDHDHDYDHGSKDKTKSKNKKRSDSSKKSGTNQRNDKDHDDDQADKEEFIHDEISVDEIEIQVPDGTNVSDVESLFDSENIEKPEDKINTSPVLPAEPKGWDKHQLPKLNELPELQNIIDNVNEKKLGIQPPSQSDPSLTPVQPPTTPPPPASNSELPLSNKPSVKTEDLPPSSQSVPHSVSSGKKDIPIPRTKPNRGEGERQEPPSHGRTIPVPPQKPGQPDTGRDDGSHRDNKGSIIIPGRKPAPPHYNPNPNPPPPIQPTPQPVPPTPAPAPAPVPPTPPSDGSNGDNQTRGPENALIGPFYPYQSYGLYNTNGGLRRASNLLQMIQNIKNEKLENQFLIQSHAPGRNRYYGNFATMDFLLKSSYWVNKLRPGQFMEVNDISSERGGPLSSHASHRNGLDMDVGYFFDGLEDDFYGRMAYTKKGFDPKFDAAFLWTYFKTMMANYHDKIYMIFVHPAIKRAMCAEAERVGDLGKSENDKISPLVLNSLRRLWPDPKGGHADHFHVRLRCPNWGSNGTVGRNGKVDKGDNAKCVMPLGDVPMRTGCWRKK